MTEVKTRYTGKYIKIVQRGNWEYVERVNNTEAAYIIPVWVDKVNYPVGHPKRNNIVFIREWRVPFQKYCVGMPAGLVGDGEKEGHEVAAARELTEETGYKAGRMRYLMSGPPSSGLSNEILHFYLADKLVKVSDEVGVEGEDITVHVVPVVEAHEWLQSQKECVIDPKSYMGLYFAQSMHVE